MKRAFLVSCNEFADPGARFRGCINDSKHVREWLVQDWKWDPTDVYVVCDNRATDKAIYEGLQWCAEGWSATPNPSEDVLVIAFSMHGSQVADDSGDESDGLDEILCVGAETLISTDVGLLPAYRVHELVSSGTHVSAKVGNKFYPIINSNKTKKDEKVRVEFENGIVTEFGIEHPVTVFNEGNVSEKKAGDLLKGDCALTCFDTFNGQVDLNSDSFFMWNLIGLFVGDGHFQSGRSIRFSVRDYIDYWTQIGEETKLRLPDSDVSMTTNTRGDFLLRIGNPILTSLLTGLGFKPGKRKMGRMGPFILPMHQDCLAGFIRGVFDSDGSSAAGYVTLCSTDYELVKAVSIALGYFGIRSSIGTRSTKNAAAFILSIWSNHADKFMRTIGFGIKAKGDKVGEISRTSGEKGRVSLSELVRLVDRWNFKGANLAEAIGVDRHCLRRVHTAKFTRTQAIDALSFLRDKCSCHRNRDVLAGESVANIATILSLPRHVVEKELDDCVTAYRYAKTSELEAYLDRDWELLNWYDAVRVVSSEVIREESEMYDFTVKDAARFEANGILVHNCPYNFPDLWENPLSDDKISQYLREIPAGVKVLMLADACHSGTLSRGVNPHYKRSKYIEPPFDIACRAMQRKIPKRRFGVRNVEFKDAGDIHTVDSSKQRHMYLSGCRDEQTSADADIGGVPQGAMTWAFLAAARQMRGGSMIQIHSKAMQLLAASGFEQAPQLWGPEAMIDTTLSL